MKTLKKVLIATDFSKSSDFALRFGKTLQEQQSLDITLVHISDASSVWDWPATTLQARNLLAQFQDEMTTVMQNKMADQQKRCEVNFPTKIIFGDSFDELTKLIKEGHADLLIMGHRGQKSLFPIGSFAKKMMSSSPVPVIITSSEAPITKVGCLLDLSSVSSDIVDAGLEFSELFNAHLSYFSSIPDLSSKAIAAIPFAITNYSFDEGEKMDIIKKAKEVVIEAVGKVNDEDIIVEISKDDTSTALSEMLEERNIDLAILSKHNRGPIEKFFMGSVSKGFIDQFKGSILILPGK